jgi:hypothetical protein
MSQLFTKSVFCKEFGCHDTLFTGVAEQVNRHDQAAKKVLRFQRRMAMSAAGIF